MWHLLCIDHFSLCQNLRKYRWNAWHVTCWTCKLIFTTTAPLRPLALPPPLSNCCLTHQISTICLKLHHRKVLYLNHNSTLLHCCSNTRSIHRKRNLNHMQELHLWNKEWRAMPGVTTHLLTQVSYFLEAKAMHCQWTSNIWWPWNWNRKCTEKLPNYQQTGLLKYVMYSLTGHCFGFKNLVHLCQQISNLAQFHYSDLLQN